MTQKTTELRSSYIKSFAILMTLSMATVSGNIAQAADDTWNHPLFAKIQGSNPTEMVAQSVQEEQALTVNDDGVPVWTDDFRPPPRDFYLRKRTK